MKLTLLPIATLLITSLLLPIPASANTTGCYVNIQGEKISFKGGCNEHGPHGYGLAQSADGKFKYSGQFVNGTMQGKGQLITTSYTYNGAPHGQGTITLASGGQYTGQWQHGKPMP